jgi:hypothetical protein
MNQARRGTRSGLESDLKGVHQVGGRIGEIAGVLPDAAGFA